MIVTFVGVGAAASSIIFFSMAAADRRAGRSDDDSTVAGFSMIIGGVSFAVVFGVPLWIMAAVTVGGLKRKSRPALDPEGVRVADGVHLLPYAAPLAEGGAFGGIRLTF